MLRLSAQFVQASVSEKEPAKAVKNRMHGQMRSVMWDMAVGKELPIGRQMERRSATTGINSVAYRLLIASHGKI